MIAAMMKLPVHVRRLVVRHRQINWTLADQGIVSAANFLTAVIVARFLGVEAFGVFSLAWLIVLLTQSFQIAFVLSPMLSIGSKQRAEDARRYFASLVPIQASFALISALVAIAVALSLGKFLGMGDVGAALAMSLGLAVAITQMYELLRRMCFAQGFPERAFVMDALRNGVQIAVLLILLARGDSAVAAILFVIAASAIVGSVALVGNMPDISFDLRLAEATASRHWRMAKWLAPSAVMQWTSGNFFVLAAGALLGPAAVGGMRAAQNLLGVTHVGFEALNNWAPVRASSIYAAHGAQGLRAFMRRLVLLTVSGTLLAVLVLALPAGLWLHLLYGTEFASYGWLVSWYGVAYLLMAIAGPYRHVFAAREDTRPVFLSYLAAAAISLTSAYPLISTFGLGGAMAGIVGSGGTFVLCLLWFWRHQGEER